MCLTMKAITYRRVCHQYLTTNNTVSLLEQLVTMASDTRDSEVVAVSVKSPYQWSDTRSW